MFSKETITQRREIEAERLTERERERETNGNEGEVEQINSNCSVLVQLLPAADTHLVSRLQL